jgi:large subunit ribosomal protein L37Ae
MVRKRMRKVGSTRGLGSRYGSTVRKQYLKVLTESKKEYKCPECDTISVKRKSVGIWQCKKCNLTFTGGAYSPVSKVGVISRRIAKRS